MVDDVTCEYFSVSSDIHVHNIVLNGNENTLRISEMLTAIAACLIII